MWVVEVPLTEGRYTHIWQPVSAAGAASAAPPGPADPTLTGARTVRPVQRIRDAYPGR
jgi:hypothetical protein